MVGLEELRGGCRSWASDASQARDLDRGALTCVAARGASSPPTTWLPSQVTALELGGRCDFSGSGFLTRGHFVIHVGKRKKKSKLTTKAPCCRVSRVSATCKYFMWLQFPFLCGACQGRGDDLVQHLTLASAVGRAASRAPAQTGRNNRE